jgi:chromosome segregation ATPase
MSEVKVYKAKYENWANESDWNPKWIPTMRDDEGELIDDIDEESHFVTKADYDTLKSELSAKDEKIKDLMSKLEAVVNQYRTCQNNLSFKDAEIFEIHAEADKEHDLNLSKITKLEQELAEAKAEVIDLREKNMTFGTQEFRMLFLEKENEELKKKLSDLTQQHTTKGADNEVR